MGDFSTVWRSGTHLPPRATGLDTARKRLRGRLSCACKVIVLHNCDPFKNVGCIKQLQTLGIVPSGLYEADCEGIRNGYRVPPGEKTRQNLPPFSVEKTRKKFWKLSKSWLKACHWFSAKA